MFDIKILNIRSVNFVFLILFVLIISLFSYSNYEENQNLSIDNIKECSLHKSKINNLPELENYKFIKRSFEVSVFPDFSNIECLGKISYIDDIYSGQKELDGFTGKKIVNVYVYTSTNLLLFLIFLFNTFFIFIIQFNKKTKAPTLALFAIFINFFIYYFLEVQFQFSLFVINLIPVMLLIFISIKKDSLHNQKLKLNFLNLLVITNILFLPFYLKLIKLQFPIDYYLINYNYGFIRRGFFGTIIYNLAKYNLNFALFLTIAILVICYSFIIYESINYIFLSGDKKTLFLIFSPVFLLYPLNQLYRFNSDIANPELFGICLMFYFLRVKRFNEKRYFFLFLLFFIISILTHEINLFIIPFIFLYYLNEKKDIWEFVLILLIVLIFLFVYFYIPIDSNNIDKMCNDLINLNIRENICENAIVNLNINYSSNNPLEILLRNFSFNIFTASNLTPLSYFISIIFGFLPVYFYMTNQIEKTLFILILLSFFPVLLYATDWGRWLYLYFSCLYIFIIRKNTKNIFDNKKNIEIGYGVLVLFLFFIFFWYNKSCCSNEVFKLTNIVKTNIFLYFVFISQILNYFKKFVN
jgi:hypothetical protein